MRKRKQDQKQQSPSTGDARITPEDVQAVEFRLAFRGYRERDVDAFLDRITEDLSSYLDELRSLRTGGDAVAPLATAAAPTSGDADEIVERARREAADIVRRAEEEAGAFRAAAAGGGSARSAVAPFLNKERGFLQDLGSLVQDHAEEIRRMVMAIRELEQRSAPEEREQRSAPEEREQRSAPEEREQGPEAEPISAARSEAPSPASFEPATAAEIRQRLGPDEEADMIRIDDETTQGASSGGPAVVDAGTEPVYSSDAGSPPGERRERSLRELFWGEE